MGVLSGQLAALVRANKLRGPRRVPEALVLVVAALEAGNRSQLEIALNTLERRLEGVVL